jgi:hypothetical protein
LSPLLPTQAESATLRFVVPFASLRGRAVAASAAAAAGLVVWAVLPWFVAPVGLLIVLAAHLLIWARTQTTAPGGATPKHEEVWAPVEDDWLERVTALEERGERWDVTPWDVSNRIGCLALVTLLGALAAAGVAATALLDVGPAVRLVVGGVVLLAPLWFNGLRTTWNPSELRRKGQALAVARATAQKLARADYDVVPTLALREGRRGKYPVDARLMLRPSREDGSGFMGVQVQVAMNSVRGTDYPYLYAVVLGKEGFKLPAVPGRRLAHGVDLVGEIGKGKDVRYVVLRQHADKSGGWHTDDDAIAGIVAAALELARAAWRLNGGAPTA